VKGRGYMSQKNEGHSYQYRALLHQLTSKDVREKYDSIPPNSCLDKMYAWERADAERLIWYEFNENKVAVLADLVLRLKGYDGAAAVKKMLSESPVPSDRSACLSRLLFEWTKEEKYLDLLITNVKQSKYRLEFVSELKCAPVCIKVYEVLKDIYLTSEDSVVRGTAVTGILHYRGFVKDPSDLTETFSNIASYRKFASDDAKERKKIIDLFEKGQL